MRWHLTMAALLSVALLSAACVSSRSQAPEQRVARAPDGTEIHYDVRGQGEPALVFVHCWAGERSFWREQLDEFASDHRVVALDLAGHGQSGMHEQVSLRALALDVKAVADALELEHCVLIGHSMGGPVSLETAPLMPGRVLGMVGVETMHDVEAELPRDQIDRVFAAFEADFDGTMRGAVRSMLPQLTPNDLVEWISSRACNADPKAMLEIARAVIATDQPALLRAAGVPVRCINSAARPPSIAETSVEHNRKYADFDAVTIDGTGHYPQLERPREFNRILREVLDRLSAPSAPASTSRSP